MPGVASFDVTDGAIAVHSPADADPARVAALLHDPVAAAACAQRGHHVLSGDTVRLDDGRVVVVGRGPSVALPPVAETLGEVVAPHWVGVAQRDGTWVVADSGEPIAAVVVLQPIRGVLAEPTRGTERMRVLHQLDHVERFRLLPPTPEVRARAFTTALGLAGAVPILRVHAAGRSAQDIASAVRELLDAP
ncbi:hypothetical protein [Nocardioides sp.]|uniref:hypothetical protein n=1 Tax=Nocardioides sp. TaxID=35761 RepID=UPI00351742B8